MEHYTTRIINTKEIIKHADYIVLGAGSGLSTAAGLEYDGDSFQDNFSDFIEKYHFKDLYTATFYDFKTQEERWAFWARAIHINRFNKTPLKLYQDILELVKEKEYFVITTNVDAQFEKAGFNQENIFATQGDYAYLQCENACHNKLYYNEDIINEMLAKTSDCKIPSNLIPKCPVCGKNLDVNLRKDNLFVEDENWHKQANKYNMFIKNIQNKKVLFLEIGVGFNTPSIIRFPFENMVYQNKNATLVRINKDYPFAGEEISHRTIPFREDTNKIIKDLEREKF